MKSKLKDILMLKSVSSKLLQSSWKSPKKSYEVFKIISSLDEEEAFYERERFKLAVSLGEEVEKGKYTIKPENEEEYRKKIEELLEMTIDIPEITFTIDDVLDSQCASENQNWYTPLDMFRIEKFLNNAKNFNSDQEPSEEN